MAAAEALRPRHGAVQALALAAGIGVVDGVALQRGIADVHDGMVQHALRERGRADQPLLGLVHGEETVVPDVPGVRQEGFAQGGEVRVQPGAVGDGAGAFALALGGFDERQAQVLRLGDLRVQVAAASHGCGSGVSAAATSPATASSNAAPYLPALASPTPSTSRNCDALEGRRVAMDAICSFVRTV